MPFCPDCGTKVSEDTRFRPEWGRPLVVGEVVAGEAGRGKSRKKLAGIIVACIVAVIVTAVVVTRPPATMEPEPAIPAHFTTYTDEPGLFSIAYPPEWELDLERMGEVKQVAGEIIRSINSDLPVAELGLLFMAGLPTVFGEVMEWSIWKWVYLGFDGNHRNLNVVLDAIHLTGISRSGSVSINEFK